jgi:hypothetical protein
MTPSLIVFDLGGTTIQDRGEVPVAFAAALDASDLESDAMAIASWRGASKREVVRRLVNDQRDGLSPDRRQALVATVYDTFRTMLTDQLRAAPALAIPEAQPAFERLKRAGIRVAVNSGFDRSIVQVILAATARPVHDLPQHGAHGRGRRPPCGRGRRYPPRSRSRRQCRRGVSHRRPDRRPRSRHARTRTTHPHRRFRGPGA